MEKIILCRLVSTKPEPLYSCGVHNIEKIKQIAKSNYEQLDFVIVGTRVLFNTDKVENLVLLGPGTKPF